MSDTLIASQNQRITELTNQLAEARSEAKKYRLERRDLRTQVESLTKDRDTLATDRDAWKGKAEAAPSDLQIKLDQATAAIRERDHRDAFTAVIGPELADKVAISDVWSKTQYKPGESVPTPEQIKELVGKAKEAAPYLFKTADQGSAAVPGGTQRPALTLDVPAGRGGPDNVGSRYVVRRSDLADASWMRNNQATLARAYEQGTVTLVD